MKLGSTWSVNYAVTILDLTKIVYVDPMISSHINSLTTLSSSNRNKTIRYFI